MVLVMPVCIAAGLLNDNVLIRGPVDICLVKCLRCTEDDQEDR